MNAPASITVTPVRVADLTADGEMQVVVVETGARPVVVGGDVAVWHGEFDEPPTEGRQRVLALDPELVWLAHEHEPWRPRSA
jgi:N-acyl homoserine lactone hydrolase